MHRPPDAGARRPGPWRHGFEIPRHFGDVPLPAALTWAAAGGTLGFIALGGVGAPVGAGCGLLAHAVRHR